MKRELADWIILSFCPSNQIGRGAYAGVLVGVMLYLMARPGIAQSRALMWALLGGLATMAILAT